MIDEESVKRFQAMFSPGTVNECWEWNGARLGEGYGGFKVRAANGEWTTIGAHRFAAALAGISIDGVLICHTCDNRKCVNPTHLFIGDHRTNSEDMVSKGRWRGSFHHKGRKDVGEWKRIPDDAVPSIIQRFKQGERQIDIAREFGVTHAAINNIVRGRRRTHLLSIAEDDGMR